MLTSATRLGAKYLSPAAAACSFLWAYLGRNGKAAAGFAVLPLALALSVVLSRFVHWYSRSDSYPGFLAAMSESCTMEVQMIKGAKNIFLGGEGLFHTVIHGPGKVWLQSMPLFNMAQALTPYLPSGGDGDGGGGINIRLGGNG